MAHKDIKKVVLAYSGGLDTSIILKWLQTEYGCEVVTFTADLGQGEELEPARKKAELLGIKEIHIDDLREEFMRDFVFPMFRANAVYEGVYLLGTSIARPLISKRLIEIAHETGADAIAHGATGKGNDQVRFELSAYALDPDIKVIAPWRDWTFKSRTDLIDFAEKHQIPVPKDKRGESPFSVDANMLHSSSEGKVLEDPWVEPPEYVHQRTLSPMDAPDVATEITIGFDKGDAVSLNGEALSPATLEPRPDTETLIDAVLPFVRSTVAAKGSCRIADLGIGTGGRQGVTDISRFGIDPRYPFHAAHVAGDGAIRLGTGEKLGNGQTERTGQPAQ